MAYIGNQPVLQSTEFREEFFPSSNQTAFTTGGFHPSAVSVTRNGVLLSESDYTKGSDNVTITLANAAVSGDVVVIRGNRSLAQGVSVSESRVEYTWQSGDTVVQLNADVIPAYTDVYLNGVKLAAADYTINTVNRTVSFTPDPAVGDVIAVVHKNETSALVALPLKKSNGTTLISEDSNGVVSLHSDILATTAQVQGVHTTATTTKATNANELTSVTAVSGYSLADVSVGDYVTGEGILVGTTVSAINGTTITLTHPDGDALSSSMTDLASDPVVFYNSTKALSAGTVAGGLCRAWVNFDGDTSPYPIRSSYNISSISRTAQGTFTVSFTTAMPDENYSIGGIPADAATTIGVGSLGTSGFTAYCYYRDGNNAYMKDPNIFCIQVFR